jgi:hypothetical protein
MKVIVLLVVLALIVSVTECLQGVDLSIPTDESSWTCLKDAGITYGKVRVYRSVGEIDTNSAKSLQSAHNAGFTDLDAYMFPCISTSPYSIANNISCKSATQQLQDTVNYLSQNNILFRPRINTVRLGRMWLDIEDENPSKYYDPDTSVNQAFVKEITDAAIAMKIPVGIYTTKTYWSQIMNNTDAYSQTDRLGRNVYPLWYPRYDGVDSLDFFEPFAGWESVLIKQTGGDVGLCDLSQVDSDYME